MNWINSWKAYNKKNIFEVNIRLGKITMLELMYCPCDKKGCVKFKIIYLIFHQTFLNLKKIKNLFFHSKFYNELK